MRRRTLVLAWLALAAPMSLVIPARGEAQEVWKKIIDQTKQKLEARKAKADSAIIARAAQTVDSTVARTGRGVDTVVNRAVGLADVAVEKTSAVVADAAKALTGNDAEDEKLAAALGEGRAVLPEIRFEGATEQLSPASEPYVERLVRVLKILSGSFVVEGHVDGTGNAATDHALSEKRAIALKARLAGAGVPAERLFALGLGATRPPTDPQTSRARIEVARMK